MLIKCYLSHSPHIVRASMYGSLIIPLSPDSTLLLNRGTHAACVSVMLFPPSVVRVRKDRIRSWACDEPSCSGTMSYYAGAESLRWLENGLNKEIMEIIKLRLMGGTKAEGEPNCLLTGAFHRRRASVFI